MRIVLFVGKLFSMSELKFITFTDVHISPTNPGARIGNYPMDILNKLDQIKRAGTAVGVDFFIFAGDLYNLKAPTRNSHKINTDLINLFKSFPAPIYCTEGNHDLRYDSYENFDEQPLSVIYASGALIQARDIKKKFGDISVHIRSLPFSEDIDFSAAPKSSGDADINICILHLYACPDGGSLFKHKIYSYEEIASLGDDIFVLGHYHVDQGIQKHSIGKKEIIFVNTGAVSRGSLSHDELKRSPKFGLIKISKEQGRITHSLNTVKLRVKPPEKVFDLEQKEEEKIKLEEAEKFVSKLQEELETMPDDTDRIKDEIQKIDLDQKVLDKVTYFIQKAEENRKIIET